MRKIMNAGKMTKRTKAKKRIVKRNCRKKRCSKIEQKGTKHHQSCPTTKLHQIIVHCNADDITLRFESYQVESHSQRVAFV